MVEVFTGIQKNFTQYCILVLVGTSEACPAGLSSLHWTDEGTGS